MCFLSSPTCEARTSYYGLFLCLAVVLIVSLREEIYSFNGIEKLFPDIYVLVHIWNLFTRHESHSNLFSIAQFMALLIMTDETAKILNYFTKVKVYYHLMQDYWKCLLCGKPFLQTRLLKFVITYSNVKSPKTNSQTLTSLKTRFLSHQLHISEEKNSFELKYFNHRPCCLLWRLSSNNSGLDPSSV